MRYRGPVSGHVGSRPTMGSLRALNPVHPAPLLEIYTPGPCLLFSAHTCGLGFGATSGWLQLESDLEGCHPGHQPWAPSEDLWLDVVDSPSPHPHGPTSALALAVCLLFADTTWEPVVGLLDVRSAARLPDPGSDAYRGLGSQRLRAQLKSHAVTWGGRDRRGDSKPTCPVMGCHRPVEADSCPREGSGIRGRFMERRVRAGPPRKS